MRYNQKDFYHIERKDGIFLSEEELTELVITGGVVGVWTRDNILYAPDLLYKNSNLFKKRIDIFTDDNIKYCISPIVPICIRVVATVLGATTSTREETKTEIEHEFVFVPDEMVFVENNGSTSFIKYNTGVVLKK